MKRLLKKNSGYGEILKKQKALYFICPQCKEPVKVQNLPDGRSFIQALIDSSLDEVTYFELGHTSCGFRFEMGTAAELAVKMATGEIT
jgi:hypothetical protein